MIAWMLIACIGWMPTINGQRADLDFYCLPPYDLGVSIEPDEVVSVTAFQNGIELFRIETGTEFDLYRITENSPVLFYADGAFGGMIVPEVSTFFILSLGVYLARFRAVSVK